MVRKNLALFPVDRTPQNILPYDGECIYYGSVFSDEQSKVYLQRLLSETPWKNDEMTMYGKHIITERKIAWYGFRSHSSEQAHEWTPLFLEIKEAIERISGTAYNSCLLNLYENGTQGLGWHHDNEKELEPGSDIASVSFGAERRFDLRHDDDKKTVSIVLEHGSLLVMGGVTQTHWRHQVAKSTKITEPRINLTFRKKIRL